MSTERNEFLEYLHFDLSTATEEYVRYLFDYRPQFYAQACAVHKAIVEAFPELDFHTVCRIKSFDSTLNKARSKTLDRVFDIHGMKHIIHSVAGDDSEPILIGYCYKLQAFLEEYYAKHGIEIIHSRTKDYIQSPKESGYEAIHLSGAVCQQMGRRFETQIKTARMESVAKYGTANHSEKYKPRTLGKYPTTKVPTYMTITHTDDGQITSHELTQPQCFQYFYNIPYEEYLQQRQTEK